jgi:O-antigen biosynthesis protein
MPIPDDAPPTQKPRLAFKFLAQGNYGGFARECMISMGLKSPPTDYQRWRELHTITDHERADMLARSESWPNPPTISVIQTGPSESPISLDAQIYSHWELLSLATLASAKGQYFCFLDPSDQLPDHALFAIADAIVADPSRDIVYGDEDTLLENNEHVRPFFKPDWSPEYFLGFPFIGRPAAFRRELVEKVGGIRADFGEAVEYDLALRMIAAGAKVHHVPDVLYHRRQKPPTESKDSLRALQAHLDATGQSATAEQGRSPGTHRVRFAIKSNPLVSIVIPSACKPITFRDRPSWFVLECVSSIRRVSAYKNIEIIVLDNNDISDELTAALKPFNIVRVPFTEPFNLTRKINLGASNAKGEQLLLLNDDVEVITPDWIESLLEFSQQPDIGAVGAQLLFPNDTQQHNGVVILDGNPRHPFYRSPADHPGYFHSSEVHRNYSAVTGACTMTRKEVFTAVGGYSEQFPLSYNDIDYCLKVLKQGKRVVYTPHARLYHHESVSRPETKPEHVNAFKEQWLPLFPQDRYYNPNLTRHFRVKV